MRSPFRLESEMQEPVHTWLSPTGETKVIYEFLMAGYCDMVGILFAKQEGRRIPAVLRATAVELKLLDIAGVVWQAHYNRHFVHASYAAMPKERCRRMVRASLRKFFDAGVGLLSVDSGVEVLVAPGPPLATLNTEDFRKRWWARIVRSERLKREALAEPTETMK